MADRTGIEWTNATWNPLVGCTAVSPGCDNCYAAREASGRLAHLPLYAGLARAGKFTGTVRLVEERLYQPLRWRRPRMIFVNSMADLFHDKVPDGYIARVWDIMGRCPQHTFQILTKRHARMRTWVNRWADLTGDDTVVNVRGGLPPMPRGPGNVRNVYTSGRARLFADMLDSMGLPPQGAAYPLYDWAEGQRWWPAVLRNVWLGVSVEDQHWADTRIPALLDTPAAVRWISAEPLLGPVDLRRWVWGDRCPDRQCGDSTWDHDCELGEQRLHWVVAGGESGPGARPAHPGWARALRDQCYTAGVPFLFKQHGQHGPVTDQPGHGDLWVTPDGTTTLWHPGDIGRGGASLVRRYPRKHSAGRHLDGHLHDQYPHAYAQVTR
jgi:protein gp37